MHLTNRKTRNRRARQGAFKSKILPLAKVNSTLLVYPLQVTKDIVNIFCNL